MLALIQTEHRDVRDELASFVFVIGKDRAGLAATSGLSLSWIFAWLGIQQKTVVLPLLVRWV